MINLKIFKEIVTKRNCEVYSLIIPEDSQWRCYWANIIIDSEAWSFSCLSDTGNFSYTWSVEKHRTFKQFLTEINMGYLMRKIEPRATEFDFEETVSNLKKELFLARRNADIDKLEARKVYEVINELDYEGSEDLVMYQLVENAEFFSNDCNWTAEQLVKKHSPEAITFTELVFPLLQEALKIELDAS